MSIKWIASAFVCTGLAFACGGGSNGGSGVSGSKQLGALNATDARKVCEYIADLQGPARTVTCMDGTTVQVNAATEADIQDCATGLEAVSDACTATVGQAEDCFEAIAALSDEDQFCNDTALPAVCAPILAQECN